jgi:ribonuclease HII
MTVVGVDEAGYGPRLGPLVLGLSAFAVPVGAGSLRDLMPETADRRGPIPVDDSKVVYRSGGGADALERSVLAFRDHAALPRVPDEPGESQLWSPAVPFALPEFATPEQVSESRAALTPVLDRAGISVLAVRTLTVGVNEFNRAVTEAGSKATVLFHAAMELIEPWLSETGDVVVTVDRHGGRSHYSELLAERLPDRYHWVVEESRTRSAYRFPRKEGDVRISFEVKGDARYLAIALASMAAKYVRELHMRAFNRWFGNRAPDLRPTAGYAVDADRWLFETESIRTSLSVRDSDLVRIR